MSDEPSGAPARAYGRLCLSVRGGGGSRTQDAVPRTGGEDARILSSNFVMVKGRKINEIDERRMTWAYEGRAPKSATQAKT